MAAEILDGRALSAEIMDEVMEGVDKLGQQPKLSTIIVGENPASELYVKMKKDACGKVGIRTESHHLDAEESQSTLMDLIRDLNEDEGVDGILVQLPLPDGFNAMQVIETIEPLKDVDGFHPYNLGRLAAGDPLLVTATPRGIMSLLEGHDIPVAGKDVVIVNHTIVVGRPLACLMLNADATVCVCHEHTRSLKTHTKKADILVSSTGVPGLIKDNMVKKNAVVIDAGIARLDDKVVGDVDFDAVKSKASHITPVPGGVGPMTIASVLENTLSAFKLQKHCTSYDSGCLS